MAVDHRRKIIFIHPSKVAGKSIENVLFGFREMTKSDHRTVQKHSDKILNEYFVFSFVRNPWDRVVSGLADAANRIAPKDFSLDNLYEHVLAYKDPKLTDKKSVLGGGLIPCDLFFLDRSGKNRVNWVGRYENLQEDWKVLCKKIKFSGDLPHINQGKGKRKHYSHYYDEKSIELVREIFAWEINEYGYEYATE